MAKNELLSFTGNLTTYVNRITERSGGGYICPLCGSGTGKNKTGAFHIHKDANGIEKWKCFSCGKGGDLLDLIGAVEGLSGYMAQQIRANELFGSGNQNYNRNDRTAGKKEDGSKPQEFTSFFLEANKHLTETNYHRGISLKTLNRFNVGFVAEWRYPLEAYLASDKPTASGKPRSKETWELIPKSPRLIIPTSESSYLARDTREDLPAAQKPYAKQKVGKVHLFNADILYSTDKPVFITEGELDALSIIDCGGEACALGSTSNTNKLIALFEDKAPTASIVLALDNDDGGKEATEELAQGLSKLNLSFSVMKPIDGYKDWNEAFMKDRGAFLDAIEDELIKAEQQNEAKEEYLHSSAFDFMQPLYDKINASVDTPFLSTGFYLLDSTLDGGLYEGLYTLGAISSLGKTTLMLQIADQIAASGNAQVLFFSLEMSRFELMARSISRHTALISRNRYNTLDYAKTARGITTGRFWCNYSDLDREVIYAAMDEYGSYAKNIYHLEGLGDVGVKQIRSGIAKHIKMTGTAPIVFVDYLQAVAPYSERMTDKQQVDKNILELKKISRDFKIPLFTISSFNRMSYEDEAKMTAFKESGSIEYSSDVLLGLHLKGAGSKDFDATEAKAKTPREIELVVLKNRSSAVGKTIAFDYDPRFNLFEEKGAITPHSAYSKRG